MIVKVDTSSPAPYVDSPYSVFFSLREGCSMAECTSGRGQSSKRLAYLEQASLACMEVHAGIRGAAT